MILDIGSGIRPQSLFNTDTWCVEPHGEYVDDLLSRGYKVFAMTWQEALKVLAPKSFDHVTILDVIEHLEKDEARALIEPTLALARVSVVLNTPRGFVTQDPGPGGLDAWGLHGGEWQRHKSGWEPEDFPGAQITFQGAMDNRGTPITQMWATWTC